MENNLTNKQRRWRTDLFSLPSNSNVFSSIFTAHLQFYDQLFGCCHFQWKIVQNQWKQCHTLYMNLNKWQKKILNNNQINYSYSTHPNTLDRSSQMLQHMRGVKLNFCIITHVVNETERSFLIRCSSWANQTFNESKSTKSCRIRLLSDVIWWGRWYSRRGPSKKKNLNKDTSHCFMNG